MTTIVHKLLWSSRYDSEHKLVLSECERATALGGTFSIVNEYRENWYSVITIHYPKTNEEGRP
jgi:hypothetical protein